MEEAFSTSLISVRSHPPMLTEHMQFNSPMAAYSPDVTTIPVAAEPSDGRNFVNEQKENVLTVIMTPGDGKESENGHGIKQNVTVYLNYRVQRNGNQPVKIPILPRPNLP